MHGEKECHNFIPTLGILLSIRRLDQMEGISLIMAIITVQDAAYFRRLHTRLGPEWRWRGFGNEATTTVQTYTIRTFVLGHGRSRNVEALGTEKIMFEAAA